MTNELKMRFLQKIKVDNKTGCWEWQGSKTSGYGLFTKGPWGNLAHRASVYLFKNEDPTGWLVCHKCNNPSCVNPFHLYCGTHKTNMADCVSAGHAGRGRGTKARHNKLKEKDVLLIYEFLQRHPPRRGPVKSPIKFLCEWFDVKKDTVADIGRGRWWSWLTGHEFKLTAPEFRRNIRA